MKKLLDSVRQFTWWQKLSVGALVVLILLTWLAVCLVLTGYFSL